WAWLLKEIIRANIDVSRRILSPRCDISPTVVKVKSSQKTTVGRVIYANSITLTPGTVSMSIDNDLILVHALSAEGAAALDEGEMDRRISMIEEDY
ncbi:MAG: Na+/H+ antiporter subunit E, partial [Gammaproteobacteria bacterium]